MTSRPQTSLASLESLSNFRNRPLSSALAYNFPLYYRHLNLKNVNRNFERASTKGLPSTQLVVWCQESYNRKFVTVVEVNSNADFELFDKWEWHCFIEEVLIKCSGKFRLLGGDSSFVAVSVQPCLPFRELGGLSILTICKGFVLGQHRDLWLARAL